jgi:hypothetical protein
MTTESIFVSYSSKDRPFAVGLVKELQKLGANIWIDQLGIGLGENWDNAIEEALEESETFMLILSPTSVDSQNVQDEVSIAINTDKKFVPILIKECDLPMRWQRRQYADLINNPEKAIGDILKFLGIEQKATENLKKVLTLIGISEAPKPTQKSREIDSGETKRKEINLEDLLISNAEMDRTIVMHKRGIKKNWQLIAFVGIVSLTLLGIGLMTEFLPIPTWMAIVAGLSINLLSIGTYNNIKKRLLNIDLTDLLKLKRDRLLRVVNKLSNTDIEEFNDEFSKYITV